MSKSTTVTVSLDEDAYGVFQTTSEIVSKAGIRVPAGQLVQAMINAEISRLSAREIASDSAEGEPSTSTATGPIGRNAVRRNRYPYGNSITKKERRVRP